jgi:hypothetical protein
VFRILTLFGLDEGACHVCALHLDHYLEAGVYVHADKLPVENACKIICTRD